jgi:hypothetical protein
MDSIGSVLGKKDFAEPDEINRIKAYVRQEFKSNVGVIVREKDFVILVPGASLANMLRLRTPDLKKQCKITKRIIIRISNEANLNQ